MRLGLFATLSFWLVGGGIAGAKGHVTDRPLTAEEAVSSAERALNGGRVGEAQKISDRLAKTHGLTKELQQRAELVVARTELMLGDYSGSEKLFSRLHKMAPEDAHISEWYARALDGHGKSDAALSLFQQVLNDNDGLAEGDSYWALAQLVRQKGNDKEALAYAEAALQRPIVIQSDELDQAIHNFISELKTATKKE